MTTEDRNAKLAEMADIAKAKFADGNLYGTPFDCENLAHVWALVFALEYARLRPANRRPA